MGATQRSEILWGDLELRVEEGAVDIGGKKADAIGLRAPGFRLGEGRGDCHSSIVT